MSTCLESVLQKNVPHLRYLCSSVPPEPLKEVTRLEFPLEQVVLILHGYMDKQLKANVRIKNTHMSTTSEHIIELLAKEGTRGHSS